MIKKHQYNITGFMRKVYYAYFGVKLGDQNKSWAPHKVCCAGVEDLRKWSTGKKKAFRFDVSMIWKEPKNHNDDCYFCCCDVKGYNSKNKKVILYPNIPSALHPAVHGTEVPAPQPTEILEDAYTNSSDSVGDDKEFQCHTESQSPQLFAQSELNDVIRDLGLSKEKAEILGSRLKEKNLLAAGTSTYWYRSRE
jgi:hypothetical protein